MSNQSAPRPFLEMHAITKSFGAIQALRSVDFSVATGEVMALLGENGAGKSTLVKILAGLHAPDGGSIRIEGKSVDLVGPGRSEEAGIAVVQQELSLVPTLSVAENVFLGTRHGGRWYTGAKLRRRAQPYLDRVGLAEKSGVVTDRLSVAERQLVEVARLLARDARILVFDEPTAALADAEIERVHRVVRSLVADGRSVVYVTHRLAEVFELADRVAVLREGEGFPPISIAELDMDRVTELMLGRALGNMFPESVSHRDDVVLDVDAVVTQGLRDPVTLQVRRGEILGLVGQMGSGTTPLLEVLGGARPAIQGEIRVDGSPVRMGQVRDAVASRIGYCSADRKRDGLFLVRSIVENLTAPALNTISPGGILATRRERTLAENLAAAFTIDRTRLSQRVDTLSGGNQQKVALGKWIGIDPDVLLVDEPTRGVDVGARAEIYAHLRQLAEQGMAIVFASSDGQEVLGLADTVATFYRGTLVRVTPRADIDEAQVLRQVTHPSETGADST